MTERPTVHAVLIGVDFYLPNELPDGSYGSLRGSVDDVDDMERFLKDDLDVPDERIRRLTASRCDGPEPPEPPELRPSYENMARAMKRLSEVARPGDQVLIYYSGHGARVPTLLPQQKGETALDECLVPFDVGRPQARYLRDVELAVLVRTMVDRGLLVTLAFDCCHSGGVVRDPETVGVRGVSFIDRSPRPSSSLIASRDEMERTWAALSQGVTREGGGGSGWLPEPRGYVLLAACRPSEMAFEHLFAGRMRGVFTYYLLDALRQLGPATTCQALHDRVLARVHSRFETQTPVLEGERTRIFLGRGRGRPRRGFQVLKVEDDDGDGERLLLAAGEVHGIRPGSRFLVYPEAADLDSAPKLALVEVTELDATICRARVAACFQPREKLADAAQAVLVDVRQRRAVRLAEAALPADLAARVGELVGQETSLELAGDERPPELCVDVTGTGEAALFDPSGELLATLGPEPEAERIVGALVHLARFRNLQEVDNRDPRSPLRGRLQIDVARLPAGYEPAPGRPVPPGPLEVLDNPAVLRVGEWICLTIRNLSSQVLNLAVLDLRPGWAIQQVYPARRFSSFEPLDAGAEKRLPLRAALAERRRRGRDVLKVFATTGVVDFRAVEQPSLEESVIPIREGPDPFAMLVETLLAGSFQRLLEPGVLASWEWTVEQIELEVVREGCFYASPD